LPYSVNGVGLFGDMNFLLYIFDDNVIVLDTWRVYTVPRVGDYLTVKGSTVRVNKIIYQKPEEMVQKVIINTDKK